MTTISKTIGYECEYIDQVLEDYYCRQCKHVARQPTISSCCTEIFCKVCLEAAIKEENPCSSCQSDDIGLLGPHKKFNTRILSLKVRCSSNDRGRGCVWTGQLQHLDAHLDLTTGDCVYVDVDCPKGCEQKVQKRNVDTHLSKECPNRDYICQHCSFSATFREVSQHFDVCPYYPLVCPNRCGATFERDDLEDHMKMCSLENILCEFSYAGCEAEFIRDEQKEHMEQNTQKHLALMVRISQKQQQTFEQMLQKQQQALEQKFQQQLQERDELMKTLEAHLQEQERKIVQLQAANFDISRGVGILPYAFTVLNYQQRSESISYVESPEMYTHPGGYKFMISVFVCVQMSPLLGVFVYSLSGDHDDKLDFPAKFEVTIQLLNQHRNQDHYTGFIQCEVTREASTGTVLSMLNTIGANERFIAHTNLKWNSNAKTQYLKNDCLKFRVCKVELIN